MQVTAHKQLYSTKNKKQQKIRGENRAIKRLSLEYLYFNCYHAMNEKLEFSKNFVTFTRVRVMCIM